MKHNKLKFGYLVIALFCLIGLGSSWENKTVSASSQIPFQLEPVIPENQVSSANYDDLLITPGTSQTLSFVVRNSDSIPRTFVIEANNGLTSDGLAVIYDDHNQKNLTGPMFSELITNDRKQKITLPAKGTQTINFNLTYPTEHFEGVILGGITVYLDDDNSNQQSNNGSFAITNRFTYSNAVQLRMNKKLTVVPKLVANKAEMTTSNAYPYVKVNISNNTRAIITQLSSENTIQDASGKVIETYKTSNGQVAPNSSFNLSIPLSNGALPAGKYRAIGTAKSGAHTWSWNQEFEVTADVSNQVDTDSVVKRKVNYWLYLSILLLLLIILLIAVIIFLIIKNRKKEDENNEKNK